MSERTEGKPLSPRKILEQELGYRDTKELWAIGYKPVLPLTPQDYSMGAVLPNIFFLMRWGYRRGKGKFVKTYGNPDAASLKDKAARVSMVADKLTKKEDSFSGFENKIEKTILADMLLAFCLENIRHETGRDKPVQRHFPTHYFSSWIDLPQRVSNLRGIPELIVSVLQKQKEGNSIQLGKHKGYFAVGSDFDDNLLLRIFSNGTFMKESDPQKSKSDFRADQFDENSNVGLDQLLTIRLAQLLGEAPQRIRGENSKISNQQPAAQLASKRFFEDLNIFLRAYGGKVPRQSLLPMIESCMAIGITNIFLSTIGLMIQWEQKGKIPDNANQCTWPVFMDCSCSTDNRIRRMSEESMDDVILRLGRFQVHLMCLQILDQHCKNEKLKDLPVAEPNPIARLNFLGDILNGNHDESRDIKRDLGRTCNKLSRAFEEINDVKVVKILENKDIHPAWRMAEAIVLIIGDKNLLGKYRSFLDSSMMIDEPNGIGRKRKGMSKGKLIDRRSFVLTNPSLEFLVHRHLRKSKKRTGKKPLSLAKFIDILRDRYGYYIDEEPPGLKISSDILKNNRMHLERRLRDLGLFIGVNDAESMKRLRQRYEGNNDNLETPGCED